MFLHECQHCEIRFQSHNSPTTGRSKFCGQKCYHLARIGQKQTDEHTAKIRAALTGKKKSSAHIEKIRAVHRTPRLIERAIKNLGKGNLGRKFAPEHKAKIAQALSGENSPFWKGGKTRSTLLERSSSKLRDWRKAVFRRDNYTCQECKQRGGKLNADHIKPFAYFPELRYELSNGRTLCVTCHRKTDTYALRGRKKYDGLLSWTL